ncbi:MAG: tetratricopeptide repeat protein [Dysgonamonadaceae bacterium]|jgi:tetratricopeptide (TPR) repeat protein|nr:tetratricopeptide repeat protein [Dysgonamonadaceae bacterium]
MKRFIILTTLFCASISLPAQTTVEQANAAYSAKDYRQAAQLYESAINENGASAAVYYNLGNAFYRLNQIAPAILNYERALLLDPGNRDIRFNLEIARLKTVDKIEPVGEFFLAEGYNAVKNLYSADQWSYIAIVSFVLLILCLFLFFFSRRIALKKTGFYSGLALLVFCLAANVFAYNQKKKLTHRTTAIIFSATTTIKSAPDNSGTDLFILHEGTKVQITNRLGEWNEIETADGNVGWIQSKEIEVI